MDRRTAPDRRVLPLFRTLARVRLVLAPPGVAAGWIALVSGSRVLAAVAVILLIGAALSATVTLIGFAVAPSRRRP